MSIRKDGGKKAVVFFLTIALLCGVLFVAALSVAPAVAYAEKEAFPFDPSLFYYRRNAESVAFYYDGDFDPSVQLVLSDEEGVKYPDEFGSTCVGSATLALFRPEDERYLEFLYEIELTENTAMEVAILPIGQRRVYDGAAASYSVATFTQGGIPTEALHAGEYLATLAYETPVVVPYYIDRAVVTATPVRYERKYLDPGQPTEIDVAGEIPDSDREYVYENLVLLHSVQADSVPGEYPLTLLYNGANDDYEVILQNSVCVITGATLTGFTFADEEFLYDGKVHALTVGYNRNRWSDVEISYDLTGMADPGKYRVTATVKKEYYEDLILSATLTVRTTSVFTSSTVEYASIEGSPTGFDPNLTMSLVKYEYDAEREDIKDLLVEKNGYRSVVVSAYSVEFSDFISGKYTLKLRPSKPTSATGVTLLQDNGGELREVEYTYENGYFVLETDDYEGFLFLKRERVTHTSITDVIVAVLIGIGVLIVLAIVISVAGGNSKSRRRSRRRHARWA